MDGVILNLIDILATIRVAIIVTEDVIEKIVEEIVVVQMTEIAIVTGIQIDRDHHDAIDLVNETGGGVDHVVVIVATVVAIVETGVAIVVIAVATGDEDKFKLPILRNDCIFIRLPDKCTLRPNKIYQLMTKNENCNFYFKVWIDGKGTGRSNGLWKWRYEGISLEDGSYPK